jgi:hypothetical protein
VLSIVSKPKHNRARVSTRSKPTAEQRHFGSWSAKAMSNGDSRPALGLLAGGVRVPPDGVPPRAGRTVYEQCDHVGDRAITVPQLRRQTLGRRRGWSFTCKIASRGFRPAPSACDPGIIWSSNTPW